MEVMELLSVHNMPKFLTAHAEKGWRVVGADTADDAVDATTLRGDVPTILVMGNEGSGLRTTVRQACTVIACIGGRREPAAAGGEPGGTGVKATGMAALGGGGLPGDFQPVDSLNVSVAAGILLHQLLH